MVGIRRYTLATASVLISQAFGQSTTTDGGLIGFFVSEGLGIYSQITSAISSQEAEASRDSAASASSESAASATAASASARTTDGSAASSSTSRFASSTRSSRTTSDGNPISTFRISSTKASGTGSLASSASAEAAAASGTVAAAATSHHGGSGNNHLAIILGCVLGALALGLLILVFLLCCRRRRRRRTESLRSSAMSPDDREVASWQQPRGTYHNRYGSNGALLGAGVGAGATTAAAAPLMSEHPAFRNDPEHRNPFVPVPPPPRRSAPNSRAGLTDGMVPGDEPYITEKGTGHPLGRKSTDSSHTGRNLALGAGGVALGAAALHHHHNKKKDEGIEVNSPYDNHKRHSINRKPISVNDAISREPWMTPSTTANDDAFAMSSAGGRRSNESARSRQSRDAARANAAFDDQYAPVHAPVHAPLHEPGKARLLDHSEKDHHHGHMGTAAALGAGALGGAALAHHHNRSQSQSLSHSRSPHRRSLLPAQKDDSDSSNTNSELSQNSRDAARANANFDDQYAPVAATEQAQLLEHNEKDHGHGHMGTAAAVGAGALGGATLAHHHNRSRSQSLSHPRSPHRRSLLAAQKHESDSSNTNSELSQNSRNYSDAVADRPPVLGGAVAKDRGRPLSQEVPEPYNIPPTPPTRSRRNSALGTAAPAAAALSYVGADHQHRDRSRSRSTSRPGSYPYPQSPHDYPRGRDSTGSLPHVPPALPRSRPRSSLRQSNEYIHEPFPEMPPPQSGPLSSSVHSAMSPHLTPSPGPFVPNPGQHPLTTGEGVSTPGLQSLHTSTGIVGDSRYPHMGLPRRRSGGEYDHSRDGTFLPASPPLPPGLASESRKNSMEGSRRPAFPMLSGGNGNGNESSETSDDTWMASHGMPGGWRNSRTQSPGRISGEGWNGRDSGYSGSGMSGGTAVTGGDGRHKERRVTLEGLRREEEELLRNRGRASMESEWAGNGGYDGYGGMYGGGNRRGSEGRYYADQNVGVAR